MDDSHKGVIYQYFPDGVSLGLNLFNENKILRMISESIKKDRLIYGRFSEKDMISFARSCGAVCKKDDLDKWLST